MFIKKEGKNIREVIERNIAENGYTKEMFFNEELFPYIKNINEAAEYILQWLKNYPEKNITIIGDYDSDGINATAIMFWLFAKLGREVKLRIPKRFSEGYGLKESIIDEIDNGLVITVDNGIAAISAIKKAKEKGLDVVVIDHHLPVSVDGEIVLPDADIIVDPAAEDESKFHNYCGGALAWRLAHAMFPELKLNELKVLAAIATVTDVMPLYGANRQLVKEGIALINQNKVVPGLSALLNAFCKNGKLTKDNDIYHLSEESFGFLIGPAFNASGRLFDKGASQVVKLLTSKYDDPRLEWRANKIFANNEERKEVSKNDLERVLNSNYFDNEPLVVFDEAIGEGIIGIIAGQLCERYNCPAIVFTKTEDDTIIKGSGRSIKEIHLKNTLDKIQELIVGYGGHAGAAGLSIKKDNLEAFKKAFIEACGPIPEKSNDIYYDLELSQSDLCRLDEICEELNKYAPYGEGNPKPVFRLKYYARSEYTTMGDGSHFMIKDDIITLVGFGLTEKYRELGCPKSLDMVGYLTESWYKSNKTFKFEIIDLEVGI